MAHNDKLPENPGAAILARAKARHKDTGFYFLMASLGRKLPRHGYCSVFQHGGDECELHRTPFPRTMIRRGEGTPVNSRLNGPQVFAITFARKF
jgi:hypothetical protein